MGSLGHPVPIEYERACKYSYRNLIREGSRRSEQIRAGPAFRPFPVMDTGGGGDRMQQRQHRGTASEDSSQSEWEEQSGVVVGGRPSLVRVTEDIVKSFERCNPKYKLPEPEKRYLTKPFEGFGNDGKDNEENNLILSYDYVIVKPGSNTTYTVKSMLGKGAFGQVYKCSTNDSNQQGDVAVKILKFRQNTKEGLMCQYLNQNLDPGDDHHIYRIVDLFSYENHVCLVFELLGINLAELLQLQNLKGVNIERVRNYTAQILKALVALRHVGVIHRDLKPENILCIGATRIKVIDFGSACLFNHKGTDTYIQSRFYRAPEVLLQLKYDSAIDMWSLGCIAAELFLGRPLFRAASEYGLFRFMIDILGSQPPDDIILRSPEQCRSKFFKTTVSASETDAQSSGNMETDVRSSAFQLLSEAEVEDREQKKPGVGIRPFGDKKLEDIIMDQKVRRIEKMEGGVEEETKSRQSFIDFLKGVLNFDPKKRWTPRQALQHPFITKGELLQWKDPSEISPSGSQASSVPASPAWSSGSTSSYYYPSPNSVSSGSRSCIPQRREKLQATRCASAGIMPTPNPASQPKPSRNQHPENGNGSLTRDAVHPDTFPERVRNDSSASRPAHPSSSTRDRDRTLRAALSSSGARSTSHPSPSTRVRDGTRNLAGDSHAKGSDGLLFSPSPRPWTPGNSDEQLLGDSGEQPSSTGREKLDVRDASEAISRLGIESFAGNGQQVASGSVGHQSRSQSSARGGRHLVAKGNGKGIVQDHGQSRPLNGHLKSNGFHVKK